MNENNEQSISINNAKTILPARGHIVKLKFNTGKVLNVNKNDIVVFVGPNNVGKSQSLSDIYQLSNIKVPTIVVSDIEVCKEGSLKQLLEMTSMKQDNGKHINYRALNHSVSYLKDHTERMFHNEHFLENIEIGL